MFFSKNNIMSLKRRDFLKGLGATLALSALPNTRSFAYQPKELQNNDEILVFVFLRGGCDSLNFIAPVGDRFYNDARPKDLRVSDKSRFNLKNGLDGLDFNIHPKAAALKELYDNDNLAIIHAAGLTNGTRSHFEAMDLIERGLLQSQGSAKGWMTRYLDTIENRDEMYSVAVGCNGLPDLFFGSNKAIGIDALSDFDIEGEPIVKEILRDFYSGNNLLDKTAQNALNTIDFLKQKLKKNPAFAKDHYHAEHGAKYPDQWHVEDFSNSLQSLAKLIKMDTGVHLAAVEYDNWDHHQNQAYKFPNQIEGLSDSLAAFYNDLSNYHNNLTVRSN